MTAGRVEPRHPDTVALFDNGYSCSDCGDQADGFVAGNKRKRRLDRPRADSWDNTKISSVAVSADGNTVYVGTGDFDGGRSAYGFGIKKSTNGGGNWAGLLKTELKGYS